MASYSMMLTHFEMHVPSKVNETGCVRSVPSILQACSNLKFNCENLSDLFITRFYFFNQLAKCLVIIIMPFPLYFTSSYQPRKLLQQQSWKELIYSRIIYILPFKYTVSTATTLSDDVCYIFSILTMLTRSIILDTTQKSTAD